MPMANRWWVACCLACLAGVACACSRDARTQCVGTEACLGEWQAFAGALEAGQPCTTPAGDLHVRYEHKSPDALVALWAGLIPAKLGLRPVGPWEARGEYRQAWYRAGDEARRLYVGVVQSGGSRVHTVRLSWESP